MAEGPHQCSPRTPAAASGARIGGAQPPSNWFVSSIQLSAEPQIMMGDMDMTPSRMERHQKTRTATSPRAWITSSSPSMKASGSRRPTSNRQRIHRGNSRQKIGCPTIVSPPVLLLRMEGRSFSKDFIFTNKLLRDQSRSMKDSIPWHFILSGRGGTAALVLLNHVSILPAESGSVHKEDPTFVVIAGRSSANRFLRNGKSRFKLLTL